jgi:hypothetical protein
MHISVRSGSLEAAVAKIRLIFTKVLLPYFPNDYVNTPALATLKL